MAHNILSRVLMPVMLNALVGVASINAHAGDPLEQMLPVSTPTLSPGNVQARTLNQQVHQPLFIVGDDALSHQWLAQKRDYLAKVNATGIVVNVRSKANWRQLKRYNLTLYPVQGDDFANAFEITHYPVFIEGNQVKQ